MGRVGGWVALATLVSALSGWADESRPASALVVPTRAEAARVVLSSLKAFDAGEGKTLVRWETAMEVGTLTFDLYRSAEGGWVRVTTEPLPAQNTPVGGRYEVLDSVAPRSGPLKYRLGAAILTGRRIDLGIREATVTESLDKPVEAPQRSEPRLRLIAREPEPVRRGVALAGPPALPIDLTMSDAAVKIVLPTNRAGIFFVSASSLATALNTNEAGVAGWLQAGTVQLSNQDQPVNYIPGTGWTGAGASGPGLFFYGELKQDNYTYANVYWLKGGMNTPATADGMNPVAVNTGTYWAGVGGEVDYQVANSIVFEPEADFYVWAGMIAGGSLATATNIYLVDHLVSGPGTNALLTVRFRGGSSQNHKIRVSVNQNDLGERTWSGLTAYNAEYVVPSSYLREGSNTNLITALLAPGVADDSVYLDSFQLQYPRSYCAGPTTAFPASFFDGMFEGGADTNSTVTVTNFTSTLAPTVQVFDVSNPRAIKALSNLRVDLQSGTKWRVSFTPAAATNRYYVAQQPAVRRSVGYPSSLTVVNPVNLAANTNRGSYVIITPASLKTSADQLANYRSGAFRTKVVLLEDVYNEFGAGLPTPHAIRKFLKTAYAQWAIPPRYVVLLGDGTYDYRDRAGSHDNLMPPLMITTDYGLFTSDSLYGDVLENGLPRVAVGRLPVLNSSEFNTVFGKIQTYAAQAGSNPLKALLIADQPDQAGEFIDNITEIEVILQGTYTSQLVHPPLKPAPVDVNAMQIDIQSALNTGVDLVTYVGHGATDRFGSQGYLYVSDPYTSAPIVMRALNNGTRLAIYTAMTCVVGQYSLPGFESLGETLLMQSGSGAGAVVAPTGPSYDVDATVINRRLMQEFLCARGSRLGDLVLQSFSLYNRQGGHLTPVWMYNILGDPALVVRVPGP